MVTAEGFAPWYLPSLPPPEAGAQEPGVGLAGPRPGFLGTRGPGGAKIGVPLQSGAFWVRTAQIKVCDVFRSIVVMGVGLCHNEGGGVHRHHEEVSTYDTRRKVPVGGDSGCKGGFQVSRQEIF